MTSVEPPARSDDGHRMPAGRAKIALWSAAAGIATPVLVGLPPAWYPAVFHAFSIGPFQFDGETMIVAVWPTSLLMWPSIITLENPSATPGQRSGAIVLSVAGIILNPAIYASVGVIWSGARRYRSRTAILVACALGWLALVSSRRLEVWWSTALGWFFG
jgi:hypothetical protein